MRARAFTFGEHIAFATTRSPSTWRAQQISRANATSRWTAPAGFDVDEPLPVGAPDVSRARAVDGAMDPHNRQLDLATNQRTKYSEPAPMPTHTPRPGCRQPTTGRTYHPPLAARTSRSSTEAAGTARQNTRSLRPTAIKNRINANTAEIISEGQTPGGYPGTRALRSLGLRAGSLRR